MSNPTQKIVVQETCQKTPFGILLKTICSICMENCISNNCIKLLCTHTFHKQCLNKLINTNDKSNIPCPNCRKILPGHIVFKSLSIKLNSDIYNLKKQTIKHNEFNKRLKELKLELFHNADYDLEENTKKLVKNINKSKKKIHSFLNNNDDYDTDIIIEEVSFDPLRQRTDDVERVVFRGGEEVN